MSNRKVDGLAAGFTILLRPREQAAVTKGGIIKAAQTVDLERLQTVVAYVADVGPDAYLDKSKFPNGPWCKKGDWVLIAMYAGSRFKIGGEHYRLINDDQIRGVIPNDLLDLIQPA